MKNLQEKVKDVVEVRDYQYLSDFNSDAAKTLSNYIFTDFTSELMAKWLDCLAGVSVGRGSAWALAGYRGVGKSHFLSVISVLAAQPELRSRISDPHVAASGQRLMRRHYTVVRVHRGTGDSLTDELRGGLSEIEGIDPAALKNSISEMLTAGAERAGDLPLVLIIDTALERGTRVARDDGPTLGEIAEVAKGLNIFVAIALDDDIAGADGMNSAISRSFTIHYLDPEHLYKVINSHIFPKRLQMQPVLKDVYSWFKQVVPGFRWSEQRFAALYPVHPAILEIAPFVRLYVYKYALLKFVSESAERVLARPANSLIALDEVFDAVEKELRAVEELNEAFSTYDLLNSEVVSKIPVLQRLQAKLVLKALLLLSLDGRTATAGEIAASMLIFDEAEPEKAVANVESVVSKFAEAMPEQIQIESGDDQPLRFGFVLKSKDDLNHALAERTQALDPTVVEPILRRFIKDRFADCGFSLDQNEPRKDWMDSRVLWRGGMRRGRIVWRSETAHDLPPAGDVWTDWEVTINAPMTRGEDAGPGSVANSIIWQPAELRADEIATLLRYHVLSTDAKLRDAFSDQLRGAIHSQAVSVEQLLNRIFLDDAKVIIDGFDYNFSEEARTARTLSQLFSLMLEPLFESRYPEHPMFAEPIGINEIGTLIADLHSSSRLQLPDVQAGARKFALPLGLVKEENDILVPHSAENVATLTLASTVLRLTSEAGDQPVSLNTISAELKREPHGLVREGQQLLLTELVAQRLVEFVTTKGDRINQRSLDLDIIWDDIVGVAKSAAATFSARKLANWAMTVSGDDGFKSLDTDGERERLRQCLADWLIEWRSASVLERFRELPDDCLSTAVWRLAVDCDRTIGSFAGFVTETVSGSITVEECLQRTAALFNDSTEEFERAKSKLAVVEAFTKGVSSRCEITSYMAGCEFTGDPEIEDLREHLFGIVGTSFSNPSDASNREMGYLWIKFQRDYAEHYVQRHDATILRSGLRQRFEEVFRTDEWWEFENLRSLEMVDPETSEAVENVRRRFSAFECEMNVRELMRTRPACTCSFTLAGSGDWQYAPEMFRQVVGEAVRRQRASLSSRKDTILKSLGELKQTTKAAETEAATAKLMKWLSDGWPDARLSEEDLVVLRAVIPVRETIVSNHAVSGGDEPVNSVPDWAADLVDDGELINI
jgi:hypothetical protein